MASEEPDDDALTQAAQWFARLQSSECTAAEREAFWRWHAQAAHAAAYAQTTALWAQAGDDALRERMAASVARVMAQTAPQSTNPARGSGMSRRAAMLMAMAATVVALLVGVQWWQPAMPPSVSSQIHASAFGQTRTVTLDDGSTLMLSSDSEVEVRMSAQLRELVLNKGEAWFDVHRDPARPFLVRAGARSVQAIGTRFLVRHDPSETVVTLLHGSVRVADPELAQSLLLDTVEELRLRSGGEVQRRRIDADFAGGWMRGRLVFRETPLSAAVEEINRHVRPRLAVRDPALASMLISGNVRVGDSASVARALAFLLPLTVETAPNGDLLLSAQASPPASASSSRGEAPPR